MLLQNICFSQEVHCSMLFCILWRENSLKTFVCAQYFICNFCLPVVCNVGFVTCTIHFEYFQLCIYMYTQVSNMKNNLRSHNLKLHQIQNNYKFKMSSKHPIVHTSFMLHTDKTVFTHRSELQVCEEFLEFVRT